MGMSEINILASNPHYYGLLLQSFLTGYGADCDVRMLFIALPLAIYDDSLKRFNNAKSTSSMDTLMRAKIDYQNIKLPSITVLSQYKLRYREMIPELKKALIVLASERIICFHKSKVHLCKKFDDLKFSDDDFRTRLRSVKNMGKIFAKSTPQQILLYLGVEI